MISSIDPPIRDLFSVKIMKLTRQFVLLHFLQFVTSGQLASLSIFFSALVFFFWNRRAYLFSHWTFPFSSRVFSRPSFPMEMTWQTALQSWSAERSCEFVAVSSIVLSDPVKRSFSIPVRKSGSRWLFSRGAHLTFNFWSLTSVHARDRDVRNFSEVLAFSILQLFVVLENEHFRIVFSYKAPFYFRWT